LILEAQRAFVIPANAGIHLILEAQGRIRHPGESRDPFDP
jgi:hypothetical protein